MGKLFEELDYQETPIGPISLRRRTLLSLNSLDIFEVKLGEEFLMSSLFYEAEIALADLGLAHLREVPSLDVVVGGLGLGYTAFAALKYSNVRSCLVVDYLQAVIGWHERHLVPLGKTLTADARCRFTQGDFFKRTESSEGYDPENPGAKFHAILLDVDHSPDNVLSPNHAPFYEVEGLRKLETHLHPGGIFALWSNDAPDSDFTSRLQKVFTKCQSHVVSFANPLLEKESTNTVYVAQKMPPLTQRHVGEVG